MDSSHSTSAPRPVVPWVLRRVEAVDTVVSALTCPRDHGIAETLGW